MVNPSNVLSASLGIAANYDADIHHRCILPPISQRRRVSGEDDL
jgi:hypothetical protein